MKLRVSRRIRTQFSRPDFCLCFVKILSNPTGLPTEAPGKSSHKKSPADGGFSVRRLSFYLPKNQQPQPHPQPQSQSRSRSRIQPQPQPLLLSAVSRMMIITRIKRPLLPKPPQKFILVPPFPGGMKGVFECSRFPHFHYHTMLSRKKGS